MNSRQFHCNGLHVANMWQEEETSLVATRCAVLIINLSEERGRSECHVSLPRLLMARCRTRPTSFNKVRFSLKLLLKTTSTCVSSILTYKSVDTINNGSVLWPVACQPVAWNGSGQNFIKTKLISKINTFSTASKAIRLSHKCPLLDR